MAWTTPRTWTPPEDITAALLNTHLKANLDYLFANLGAPAVLWFPPNAVMPTDPASVTPAQLMTRNGILALAFDDSADEYAVFRGQLMPAYAGGGITVDLLWMAAATSGDVVWEVQIERGTTDLDSDSFAAANTDTTTIDFVGVGRTSITFTDGADMDSLAAGEFFRLLVTRTGTSGSDTATGDAQLCGVSVYET